MIQFAEVFPDPEIVSTLSTQLTWSHFVERLPLDFQEKRMIIDGKDFFLDRRFYHWRL